MVAIPLTTTSLTIASIDAHYEAHQDVRLPQRLTARLLGLNCERQGWYAFRWAHTPKRFPGSIVRANLSRQEAMNDLGQALADTGVKVERNDPKTFMPFEVMAADGHYRQKIAGKATGILEAPVKVHLLYADQQQAKVFAQIVKHGLAVAKPDRIPALQIGMHLMGLDRTFYLVRNKDTDELHAERIEHDAAQAIALLAKADRIRDAHTAPPRVSEDDPNWFECRFCPAFDNCHAPGFALRNCRTCIHSTPVAGGAWHCGRHRRELSANDQEVGCPNHLYLPDLVPGEQTDANPETETITYTLRDGSRWIDGENRSAQL